MAKTDANFENFKATCQKIIEEFGTHPILMRIREGKFTHEDYRRYLMTIFHQTFYAPSTMGLAAALCKPKHIDIRTYLTKHAAEEHEHWKWVADDLKNTGYKGEDLTQQLPSFATTQFVAFAYFLAVKFPIARLGLPAILEGLSAKYAGLSAKQVHGTLGLKNEQMVFAKGHGELDGGHTEEIFDLLSRSDLDQEEWTWMIYAAQTTAKLYSAMLDEVIGVKS